MLKTKPVIFKPVKVMNCVSDVTNYRTKLLRLRYNDTVTRNENAMTRFFSFRVTENRKEVKEVRKAGDAMTRTYLLRRKKV